MSLGAAPLTFPLIRLARGTGWGRAVAAEAQGEAGDLASKSQPGVSLICSCCDLITHTQARIHTHTHRSVDLDKQDRCNICVTVCVCYGANSCIQGEKIICRIFECGDSTLNKKYIKCMFGANI